MKYPSLEYQTGFEHQVKTGYVIQTPIKPEATIVATWGTLETTGLATIKEGFGTDGTSFYARTFKATPFIKKQFYYLRKGSIVHDFFYYLFKKDLLPLSYRPMVDAFAREIWIDSGAWGWFAKLNHWGLKKGGGTSALPENDRPIYTAP